MKKVKKMFRPLVIFLLAILIIACNKKEEVSPTPENPTVDALNKIMPLGASRVAGAPPEYESYRYELWKLLVDGGYDFDFVGIEMDQAGLYADYKGQKFDLNHEGRGGIDSGGILEQLKSTLKELSSTPDIVLFSSPGGNDGIDNYSQTILNINAIIDEFQAVNPNITMFIELPAPPLTNEQSQEFLDYYRQALKDIVLIAEQRSTATSRIITVDMTAEAGFIDAFLADDVHYNQAGATFIAGRYFEVLKDVLK